MADLNTQSARAAFKDRANDLYESPPVAVHALLANYDVPNVVWEPACGPGSIVRILRGSGRIVYATDLVDYDSPDQDEAGWDFLMEPQVPIGVEAIITNPPFKLAHEFVRHALSLCPRVIMLLRLAFLEGQRRSDIMDDGRLERVLVFKNRLPFMHRASLSEEERSQDTSAIAYAWFIWNANHSGDAIIKRISWSAVNESGRDLDAGARAAVEGTTCDGEIPSGDSDDIGDHPQYGLWENP